MLKRFYLVAARRCIPLPRIRKKLRM